MFGGCAVSSETSVPKYLNDARQLDTNSMSWSLLSAEGSPPSGRCGHSASLQSDGRSIVFYGGWGKRGCQTEAHTADPKAKTLHVLQLVKLQWSSPPCGERKPPKHTYYHSACVSGDSVIVFGGFDGRQASNMVISLRVEGTERVTMENGPASSIATPALNDE